MGRVSPGVQPAPPCSRAVTNPNVSPPRSVESRPGFAAVELRLRNYYYDVVN